MTLDQRIEHRIKLTAAEVAVVQARKHLAEAQANAAQMLVAQWERAVLEHEARLEKLRLEVGE